VFWKTESGFCAKRAEQLKHKTMRKIMSYNYGYLKAISETAKYPFKGELCMKEYFGSIAAQPATKHAKDSPDYNLFGLHEKTGQPFQIGKIWRKTPNDGGAEFFSIQIDSPDFEKPVNLTGFSNEPGLFDIVWSRPKKAKSSQAKSNSFDDAEEPQKSSASDEIMY
jgi:uncharacterized protein (DUF736 family)